MSSFIVVLDNGYYWIPTTALQTKPLYFLGEFTSPTLYGQNCLDTISSTAFNSTNRMVTVEHTQKFLVVA